MLETLSRPDRCDSWRNHMAKPIIERFLNRVEMITETGCWIWMGCIKPIGYGCFGMDTPGRKRLTRRAHRVAYELFIGPIPEGMTLDHLCRIRCCVNPHHLEPVSQIINVQRAKPHRLRQTVCKRGHEMTPANTRKFRNGRLRCRECQRIRKRRSWKDRATTPAA